MAGSPVGTQLQSLRIQSSRYKLTYSREFLAPVTILQIRLSSIIIIRVFTDLEIGNIVHIGGIVFMGKFCPGGQYSPVSAVEGGGGHFWGDHVHCMGCRKCCIYIRTIYNEKAEMYRL